jgi:hypothetical protein
MAEETPKSNTSSTTASSKPSKAEGLSKAADMLYSFGSRTFGDRAPGKFASIGGFFSYGTNRDGRTGVMIGGKFIPTSNAVSTTTSTSGASKPNTSTGTSAPTAPTANTAPAIRRVVPSGNFAQMMRETFPESFKDGGLVRGAGKATKGRGRGKMV